MATLTPILTATPGNPLTYNVGMAETFSWIPVENDADRPIYARATYLTNASDISVSLSAGNINVSLDGVEASLDSIETLLAVLTGINDEQQTATNTLLDGLTSIVQENTDNIEELVQESNLLLNGLTAVNFATSSNQQQTNTLLDTLTSSSEQIKIDTASSVTLLSELTSSNIHVAGFNIPPYDEINLEYEGTTDYLRKVSYLESSTEVLALSFVYVTEPPTSSDNRILKVKKL